MVSVLQFCVFSDCKMPELPEVETIRRGLEKYVVGYTIEDVDVRLPKMVVGKVQNIIGAKIQSVRRFGKGLVIDLDNGYSLAIHVKMTGQLIFRKVPPSFAPPMAGLRKGKRVRRVEDSVGELPGKHTHVIFKLKTNPSTSLRRKSEERKKMLRVAQHDNERAYLYYNDQRQFGWVKILKTADVSVLPFFKSLGKEPLKDLTRKDFAQVVASAKQPVKIVIMDQARIAGIGNIYANDALFRAKINPKRAANSLTKAETKELFDAIEAVLQKGIEAGGASEWHYVDVLGGKGKYQNFFLVYGKDGKPCSRCGTTIERIKLGGRGTFFCPQCQQ